MTTWYQYLAPQVTQIIDAMPDADRLAKWRAANERRKELELSRWPLKVWRQLLRDSGIARQRQRKPRSNSIPLPNQKRLFDV